MSKLFKFSKHVNLRVFRVSKSRNPNKKNLLNSSIDKSHNLLKKSYDQISKYTHELFLRLLHNGLEEDSFKYIWNQIFFF